VPVTQRAGTARLPEVAHERHRARWTAPGDHAPLHRAEVLGLVDEDVAERARLPDTVLARRRAALVALKDFGGGCVAPDAEVLDDTSRVLERAVGRAPAASPA